MDFGHLLVEKGLISPQELEEALAIQRRAIDEGRDPVPMLGEILVEKGYLTGPQVADALEAQNKEILFCPKCRVQVNVEKREHAAGYRCGTCESDLVRPVEMRNVRVSTDTSVILISRQPPPEEVRIAALDTLRKFGKYVLLEEVGRGGAAVVHRAWDTYLKQFVALKFIRPPRDAFEDEKRETKILELLDEARHAIRLRHPNIVPVYDAGRIGKEFYIAMEYLEGRSLSKLIRQAKQQGGVSPFYEDPRRYVAAMRDVARAVHYAHTRQVPVIHCDLKPSNILIDVRGRPWVLDFGLARHLRHADGGDAAPTIRGTPSYMAPEQAAGETQEIDVRTDVYGLGAVLYELLTGRQPFTGDVVELLRRVLQEPPEPPGPLIRVAMAGRSSPRAASERAMAQALERLTLRSLEKEKAKRPQTAREFADELDRALRGDAADVRALATRRRSALAPAVETWARRARTWGTPLLAITCLVLAAVVLARPAPADPARDRMEAFRRRMDAELAALMLDRAEKVYSEAVTIVPAGERKLLDDVHEDGEWLRGMHDRLIGAINQPRRYVAPLFKLRDRELRQVEVLRATEEKLVVFSDDRTAEVAWGALEPETFVRMVTAMLLDSREARASDRMGLAVFCAKNGRRDQARFHLEALRGTDLDVVARRHLVRLDRKEP